MIKASGLVMRQVKVTLRQGRDRESVSSVINNTGGSCNGAATGRQTFSKRS